MAKLVWQSEFIWQSDDGMVTGAEKECREYEERLKSELDKKQTFSSFSSQDLVVWASAYKRIWLDWEIAYFGKEQFHTWMPEESTDQFEGNLDQAFNSGKPEDLIYEEDNDYYFDLYKEACQLALQKGNGCKPIDVLKEQMLRTSRKKYSKDRSKIYAIEQATYRFFDAYEKMPFN